MVIQIPNKELKANKELAYLEMKFHESFGIESDPKQKVLFHEFNDEWEDYVELDKHDSITDWKSSDAACWNEMVCCYNKIK